MIDVAGLWRGVERIRLAGIDHEELDHDRRHVRRRDLDHVLPPLLVLRHRHLLADGVLAHVAPHRVVEPRHAALERVDVDEPAHAHRLERREVEVERVVVLRQVDHLPHLRRPRPRRLRRRGPQPLPVDVQVSRVAGGGVFVLVHHDVSLLHCIFLGDGDVVEKLCRNPGVVPRLRRRDQELHHLAVEVVRRVAAGVRVRRRVDQLRFGGRGLGEVDDDVERLGDGDEDVAGGGRLGEVVGVGADDGEGEAVGEREVEEARVAGVDDAESVAAAGGGGGTAFPGGGGGGPRESPPPATAGGCWGCRRCSSCRWSRRRRSSGRRA
uniref:Uncharacterized protein n=1 Tax=Oryza brachyantha TaxID=4533 RepID=J3KW02_ORYBR